MEFPEAVGEMVRATRLLVKKESIVYWKEHPASRPEFDITIDIKYVNKLQLMSLCAQVMDPSFVSKHFLRTVLNAFPVEWREDFASRIDANGLDNFAATVRMPMSEKDLTPRDYLFIITTFADWKNSKVIDLPEHLFFREMHTAHTGCMEKYLSFISPEDIRIHEQLCPHKKRKREIDGSEPDPKASRIE